MHIHQCDVSEPSFHISYVGSVNVSAFSELFLRKPSGYAKLAHSLSESHLEIAICICGHGKRLCVMMYIGLHDMSGINVRADQENQ